MFITVTIWGREMTTYIENGMRTPFLCIVVSIYMTLVLCIILLWTRGREQRPRGVNYLGFPPDSLELQAVAHE